MNLVLRTAGISALLAIAFAGCGGNKTGTTTTTTTTTATTAPAMGGAGTSSGMAAQAAVPAGLNCGAVQPVWVNTRTHVYHEPTDPYYGKTKNGKYMCPSAAAAEGDRASGSHAGAMNSTDTSGTTTGKHHRKKSY